MFENQECCVCRNKGSEEYVLLEGVALRYNCNVMQVNVKVLLLVWVIVIWFWCLVVSEVYVFNFRTLRVSLSQNVVTLQHLGVPFVVSVGGSVNRKNSSHSLQ